MIPPLQLIESLERIKSQDTIEAVAAAPSSGEPNSAAPTRRKSKVRSQLLYNTSYSKKHVPSDESKQQISAPHAFQVIHRKQRVDKLTTLFIQKLKQNIVLRSPLADDDDSDNFLPIVKRFLSRQGISQENYFSFAFEVLSVLVLVWSFLLCTVAIVFPEIANYSSVIITEYIVFVFYFFEMILQFFIQRERNGRKYRTIREISLLYLRELFVIDFIFWFIVLMDVCRPALFPNVCKLTIVLKIPRFYYFMQRIANVICISPRIQHIWKLCMVLLINFAWAHTLCICLSAMTYLNTDSNWWIRKQIDAASWGIRYVYGYYWAFNIMLTVGFGDLSATNEQEALCLVGIELMGCVMFSYNISFLTEILASLKSVEKEKEKYTRNFNRIYRDSGLNDVALQQAAKIHINRVVSLKSHYGLDEEKETLGILDEKIRNCFLTRLQKPLIEKISPFNYMKPSTLREIALKLEKKIAYPEQIVAKKGEPAQIQILSEGKVSYVLIKYARGEYAREVIAQLEDDTRRPVLPSVQQALRGQPEPYDAVSQTYSILHSLSAEQLEQVLRERGGTDFELYCQERDRMEIVNLVPQYMKCGLCKLGNHTKFECPALHYVPIKEMVRRRYLNEINSKVQVKQPRRLFSRRKKAQNIYNHQDYVQEEVMNVSLDDQLQEGMRPRSRNSDTKSSVLREGYRSRVYEMAELQQRDMQVDRVEQWKQYFPQYNMRWKYFKKS